MNSVETALMEQRRLLLLEYEEEKKAFQDYTRATGVERLLHRGLAWHPLRLGKTYYNSLNRRVVEVTRTSSESDPDHEFEPGRPVAFFTETPLSGKPALLMSGTVSFVDGDLMAVALPDDADPSRLESASSLGVALSFDETTYHAMFEAIDRVAAAKGRLGELRDLLYSRRRGSELTMAPMGFPYLNASQQEAVNKVLRAKDVAVVHGPPGTGKTTTLVEAIYETLRRESQVLVCAQSNMAVDWISEKLVDRGLNVVRLGNPTRVNDKMLSFTYERRYADHPAYPDLWSLRRAMRELRVHRRSDAGWHQKMERLKSRATELEIRINNDILGSAHVIACTLAGSASRLLDGMKFSTLFIDEAAQAMQAATLIPLRRAGRIILAGDHCQLPPTVKCLETQRQGLAVSLMERIVELHPEAVSLLTTQYRMHHDIMSFPSRWFYGGAMKASPEVAHRGILDLDTAIEWIDTSEATAGHSLTAQPPEEAVEEARSFRETVTDGSFGRENPDEALFALLTLQRYVERIGMERFLEERIDVGLISPYRAQVRLLRRLFSRTPFFRPLRHLVTINTVDGFQGQERDVVMISMVRSNEQSRIGFLGDLRRMNVAITRARMKLIIIGDATTLGAHTFYRELHRYIDSLRHSGNMTASETE